MKTCINIRIIRTRMISTIIWVKWRSVNSIRMTRCLLMASKMIKGIDLEASHYSFVTFIDFNKSFEEDRKNLWERSHSFVRRHHGPLMTERRRGRTWSTAGCLFSYLSRRWSSPGCWGGQRSLRQRHQHHCGPQIRERRKGSTWGSRGGHFRLWTHIGWSIHDEACPIYDEQIEYFLELIFKTMVAEGRLFSKNWFDLWKLGDLGKANECLKNSFKFVLKTRTQKKQQKLIVALQKYILRTTTFNK